MTSTYSVSRKKRPKVFST